MIANDYILSILSEDVRKQCVNCLRKVPNCNKFNDMEQDHLFDAIAFSCEIVMTSVNTVYKEDENNSLRLYLLKYAALLFSSVMDAVEDMPEEIDTPDKFSDFCILVLNSTAESLS